MVSGRILANDIREYGFSFGTIKMSDEVVLRGAIFDQNTDEIQNVFKYAMTVHNQNISSRRLELQAYVDVINTADAFKLSRLSE
ncbi:unnamed protein product [Euphydryas editha]|uniref:Uncharacterized protein n=1 Tax=Euphydryas editha TaxID=104508 RepID=A0AAU9UZB9_EUPED|nr:unnamed protein product [Euphydryas editha]